jgi:hypothetical protein
MGAARIASNASAVIEIVRLMQECRHPRHSLMLDRKEHTANSPAWTSRIVSAHYPFVVVRIRCRVCARKGSYRLARIAAKYGPEITLRDLLDRFSYDCLWRTQSRTKKGRVDCGVYLPDLEHKRPPDMPPGMVKLRLVVSK